MENRDDMVLSQFVYVVVDEILTRAGGNIEGGSQFELVSLYSVGSRRYFSFSVGEEMLTRAGRERRGSKDGIILS